MHEMHDWILTTRGIQDAQWGLDEFDYNDESSFPFYATRNYGIICGDEGSSHARALEGKLNIAKLKAMELINRYGDDITELFPGVNLSSSILRHESMEKMARQIVDDIFVEGRCFNLAEYCKEIVFMFWKEIPKDEKKAIASYICQEKGLDSSLINFARLPKNSPDKIVYNNKVYSYNSEGATPFIVCKEEDGKITIFYGEAGQIHKQLEINATKEMAKKMYAEKLENANSADYSECIENARMYFTHNNAIDGRYWQIESSDDVIFSFWNDTKQCDKKSLIKQICEERGLDFSNAYISMLNKFIKADNSKKDDSAYNVSQEGQEILDYLRQCHNPDDDEDRIKFEKRKKEQTALYRKNRDDNWAETHKNDNGTVPSMAQWHALTSMDESKKNKRNVFITELLNETKMNKRTIFLTEGQIRSLKTILNESAQDKAAIRFLKEKGVTDYDKQMEIIGTLKRDIPNLKLDKGRFMVGALRLFYNKELSDEPSMDALDDVLKNINISNQTDTYDFNLNDMSLKELVSRYEGLSKELLATDKKRSSESNIVGSSDYEIIPIKNYDEAKEYGKYTSWCVTHGKEAFREYTKGFKRFYFCLKHGFENIPKNDEGAPLNEWGLSMIAVNVDKDGKLTRITTRYNHDFNGENNPGLNTTKQLEEVLNVPFYDVFKPYPPEEQIQEAVTFQNVQELLYDDDRNLEDMFPNLMHERDEKLNEYIHEGGDENDFEFYPDFKAYNSFIIPVELENKWNYINKGHKLISPNQWFDYARDFSDGFGVVGNYENGERKWNFINTNGELVSPDLWFDAIYRFDSNGLCMVKSNGQYNYFTKNGELLFPDIWSDVEDEHGSGYSKYNDKYYCLKKNGKCLYYNILDGKFYAIDHMEGSERNLRYRGGTWGHPVWREADINELQ